LGSDSLKIISFDMNGTLTNDRFIELIWHEGVPRLYSEVNNIPFKQAKEYVFREYERIGEERIEWYDIKYWFRFFGLGEGWIELMENYRHEITPYSEVISVLNELSHSYELVVTTNAYQEFFDIELGASGLSGYFTKIFSSTSDFGEVKKTPEVYLKICYNLGIKPEEMAHVGDHRLFDFIVPKEMGIRAYYLDRDEKEAGDFIVKDLREFQNKLNSSY